MNTAERPGSLKEILAMLKENSANNTEVKPVDVWQKPGSYMII
jgi:prephenate dehydratase